MHSSKPVLLGIATVCVALIAAALYLQVVKHMLPCPWCVMQRYAFLAIALFCLIAAAMPRGARRVSIGLATLAAFTGVGMAAKHVHLLANPELSCGIDPLETGLNKIFLSQWWPTLFRADGLCDTPYPPTLGLSVPAWALLWFCAITITLLFLFFSREKTGLFGRHR
ncbi:MULTISPECIES: disulfide bond formation protein B [unclassified Undibacterium]|uniref:disulfide bond formation protein B n=1 Tax=unclassified Undibacterium TaxID=2630295 RepID=UPI002AC9957D|nr:MULTISPECIES: disulfide bond formation protein B [unclassified Undibacterium]MEB0140223.1 disulfide bond formation protein B [Undibacterium sp. CCC2.1]MEB0173238.1 disulfide bond formation protein B [Undibacterium sp. CCC1.1]MEB0177073.1 disulfide bond formation protein B [Undibacterium sp. CCC3.4]MEB0216346.1 disulfide bond formation protein B [Undibacterium sp. 5I2]WPX45199.1 disulfide bond formation protein B [Undibacterium sp. CCC3.4]